jgi:hypothetical protein
LGNIEKLLKIIGKTAIEKTPLLISQNSQCFMQFNAQIRQIQLMALGAMPVALCTGMASDPLELVGGHQFYRLL